PRPHFLFYIYVVHPYLHSFPTRRSSDLPSWLVLLSCCVASCIRSENCAFSNSSNSVFNSSALLARNSLAFMVTPTDAARKRSQTEALRQQAEKLRVRVFRSRHPFHTKPYRAESRQPNIPGFPCPAPAEPEPAWSQSAYPGRPEARSDHHA